MVKSCHVTCRVALDKAVAQGLILKNPALACRVPATHPRRCGYVSIATTLNVYATTEVECEEKLAMLIAQMKEEIVALRTLEKAA